MDEETVWDRDARASLAAMLATPGEATPEALAACVSQAAELADLLQKERAKRARRKGGRPKGSKNKPKPTKQLLEEMAAEGGAGGTSE